MVDGDLQKILPLVRQAVELGADIIKADPTDDVSVYHRVVQIAGGIPVLVRGGGEASDTEILQTHRATHRSGRIGHRVRPQHHPARQPRRYDARADVVGP
jgi:class I fructose-bisphosphate aldolase